MRRLPTLLVNFLVSFPLLVASRAAFAQNTLTFPKDVWATWWPDAASPVKERLHEFHHLLMIIAVGIVIVVGVAMAYTLIRFRRSRNPIPSKITHNVPLEIIWTVIPCFILLIIMWYSLPMMYYMDKTAKPDMTLKVTGYQWYWGYSYPEQEIDEYSLYMVPTEKDDPKNEFAAVRSSPTYQRLLSNYELSSGKPGFLVLPVQKNIRILVTASDVIHSFALPSFGIKKDAVPGRTNDTWIRINQPGIYYGQCSELCGLKHGFMPIEVRAVPQDQFDAWAKTMKTDLPGAMAKIQEETAQYAHPQVVAPVLTINDLVEKLEEELK